MFFVLIFFQYVAKVIRGYTVTESNLGSLATKLNMWDHSRSEDNSSVIQDS